MVAIKDIAEVNSGLSFRGKIKADRAGEISVIQMRDLMNDYSSIGDSCLAIDRNKVKEKHLLKKGDLLFIAKGNVNTAIYYNGSPENAVATSVFFVVRIDKNRAVPGYVQWYLNLSQSQKHFKQNQTGTYTPAVKKDVVEEMQLTLPDLKVQEKISKIYALEAIESRILSKLQEMRSSCLNSLLLKTAEAKNQ